MTVLSDQLLPQKQIGSNKVFLASFVSSEPVQESQRHFLAAFEWLCGSHYPSLTRLFAKVLMQLYDADLLDEEVLLMWWNDEPRNNFTVTLHPDSPSDSLVITEDTLTALRVAATPFFTWLQEAEEEDEEEEDA